MGLLLPHTWPWEARALLGWAAFCVVILLRLAMFWNSTPQQTKALATLEDETRTVGAMLTTATALMSLVGVFFTLHLASQEKGLAAYWLTGLAVMTVALSWLLIQMEYTLHYAHRFYTDGAGVQFIQHGSDEPLAEPTLQDFAYLSFTIGMTFQVSDTNLDTQAMRRLLLGHSLLSYMFSAVIVAVTINALAGVLG